MRDRAARLAAWLWPCLVLWAPMVVWFAAFKPGIMTSDSLVIWKQATQGDWVDLHPPIYTLGMWVSAEVVGSPALLTLGGSFVLAVGITSLARSVIALGAPRRAVLVVTALVTLSPMVGGFSATLWKDIPYSGFVLLLGARTVDLVGARLAGDAPLQNRALYGMVPVGMGLVALRQNGLILLIVAAALLVIVCRDRWRQLAVVATAAAVTLAVLKVVIYPVADIEPAEARFAIGPFLADIAAVAYAEPGLIAGADKRAIEEVAPVEVWADGFIRYGGCQSLNWLHERDRYDWEVVNEHPGEYRNIALRLATETPGRVIGNHLCQGAVAWRPDPEGVLYTVSRGVDPNDLDLGVHPVSERLNEAAIDVLDLTDESEVQWLLWRAPGWIYAAMVAVAVAAWRTRRFALLGVLVPLFAQQLSVLAINFAQDARYMMASLIAAPILATLGWWRPDRPGGEASEGQIANIAPGAADR